MKKLFILVFIFQVKVSWTKASDTIPSNLTSIDKVIWLNDKARANLDVNPELSRSYSTAAKTLAASINYVEGLANALNYAGLSYYNQAGYAEAINHFQQAVKFLLSKAEQQEVANLFQKIGMCYLQEKNYRSGTFYYLQALRIFEQLKYEDNQAQIHYDLGIIYYLAHEYNKAVESLLTSAEKHNQLGNLLEKTRSIYQLGITYEAMGNYKNALGCYHKALRIYESLDNREQILITLISISNVHTKLKQFNEADNFLNNALNLAGLEHIEIRGQIYLSMGHIANLKKDYKEAERFYEKAQNIAIHINNRILLKNVYKNFHKLYSTINNTRKSMEFYHLYNVMDNNQQPETEIPAAITDYQSDLEDLYAILLAISLIINLGLLLLTFVLFKQKNKLKESLHKYLSKKVKLL